MGNHKILPIVGFLLILSGGIASAQVTTGTISGTVRDSSGAALPGVQIVILNEQTGISRTVQTDPAGRYSAPLLSLGNYRVTGTLEGFQTEVRSGIELTVGREAIVDLSLTVGAMTQSVEVTGEAPLVETTTATLGSLVDDRTIRELPLNGRSYDQLAELQPSVTPSNPGVNPSSNGDAFRLGSGKQFSVGGQRTSENAFLLDGTNIDDQGNGTPGGAAGLNLGVDTILEFKIYTSSYKAEFGRVSGAVVSAITRSGTNTFHGTGFEYIRNSVFDARNFFDTEPTVPPFRRNQFGGVLGGPIKKDKMFFFAGYEGLRQAQATTQIATVPTALAREGILPTAVGATTTMTVPVNPIIVPFITEIYPLPNGRDYGDGTAQYLSAPTTPTNEDNFMARLDYQLNDKTGIFGRYTFDTDSLYAPQNLPDQTITLTSRRQYATLQANSILSPNVLNNVRFAFNRSNSLYVQNTVPDPGSAFSFVSGQPMGGITVGSLFAGANSLSNTSGAGNGPFQFTFNNWEWGDDLSYLHGRHSFKAGVDIQRMQENTSNSGQFRGAYSFATLATLLAGTPSNLTVSAPLGHLPYNGLRQSLYSAYAQDDFRANSRLTLNLGLRWEIPTDPYASNGQMSILPSLSADTMEVSNHYFTVTKKNLEPRVGLAWQVNGSGKTVLRAGGGIYHGEIGPWIYGNTTRNPPFFGSISVANPSFPDGALPYAGYTPSATGNGLIVLNIMAPVEKTPVSDQYSLSIQQEIFRNTVVEVAFAGNRTQHLEIQREGDTAVPTYLGPNDPFFPVGAPRENPAWAGIQYNDDIGLSTYNSLTTTLRQQFSRGFQGQIFYTYSKALDDATSVNAVDSGRNPPSVLDPNNIPRDYGLSDYNAKHNVVFNASYLLPFQAKSKTAGAVVNGWTLSGIGQFSSGQPFTARLASNVSRDKAVTLSDRPNLNPGFSTSPTSGVSAGCNGFLAGTPVGTPNNWYNPCAFSLPEAGTYGDLGKDTIIGPGLAAVNLALEKNFKLREKANATFRFEMFNVANHPNFGLPYVTPLAVSGAANPSAGVITYTSTSSRQLQFALRIGF